MSILHMALLSVILTVAQKRIILCPLLKSLCLARSI